MAVSPASAWLRAVMGGAQSPATKIPDLVVAGREWREHIPGQIGVSVVIPGAAGNGEFPQQSDARQHESFDH